MQVPFVTPLGRAEIAAAGVPGDWVYGYADRVRFAEIDRLNHVNNLAYLQWFEVLRVRYFVAMGLTKYLDDDPQIVHGRVSRDLVSRVRRSWIDFCFFCARGRRARATARRCAREDEMNDDRGDERAGDVERYDADVDAERSRQGVVRGGGRHVETRARDWRSMTTRGAASADDEWMS